MGKVIIHSALVVGCIGVGAFAVYSGLGIVFADTGPEETGPTRAEKLEGIFSEPGTPPGETHSSASLERAPQSAAADPYTNPVGVLGVGANPALRSVASSEIPPATAVSRWWPAEPTPSGFGIRHVGPLAGEHAIAIFFHGAVDAEALSEHVTVRDAQGATLASEWRVPNDNSRLATLPVPSEGRYTLIVNGRLADVRGRALGTNLHGPVFVQ